MSSPHLKSSIRCRNINLTGADVGDFDFLKGLLFGSQVAKTVNEGVDLELFFMIGLIQNEVRGKEHKVSELIPL